jgi:hypothetical protein
MLRATLDVPDALPPKLLLELGLPAPGRVLPALVRQQLSRSPVRGHRTVEPLEHQRRALVVGDGVAHHEPRVVVHEAYEIEPLVPAQQEREDVRLPQLVGLRPLEAPFGVIACRLLLVRLEQTRLVQDAPNRRLADANRLEAPQHVRDAPRPVLRVLLLHRRHRCSPRVGWPASHRLDGFGHQSVDASLLVPLDPALHRAQGDANDAGHRCPRHTVVDHLAHHAEPEVQRVRPGIPREAFASRRLSTCPAALSCPALPAHPVLHSG